MRFAFGTIVTAAGTITYATCTVFNTGIVPIRRPRRIGRGRNVMLVMSVRNGDGHGP